jgi:hypothetical protein
MHPSHFCCLVSPDDCFLTHDDHTLVCVVVDPVLSVSEPSRLGLTEIKCSLLGVKHRKEGIWSYPVLALGVQNSSSGVVKRHNEERAFVQ